MTLFSKIIQGEIPCYRIAENYLFFAFLDINPLVLGHTLVVPKVEVDRFLDMEPEYLREILIFSRPLALALERAVVCRRVGLSVVGLEVPHAHLHLVPLNSADDLNFTRPKLSPAPEQMLVIQQRICSFLA